MDVIGGCEFEGTWVNSKTKKQHPLHLPIPYVPYLKAEFRKESFWEKCWLPISQTIALSSSNTNNSGNIDLAPEMQENQLKGLHNETSPEVTTLKSISTALSSYKFAILVTRFV